MIHAKMTDEPVKAGQSPDAEFLRFPAIEALFGLKRAHVYELINQGFVKSVVLRKPGARTGVRLVQTDSLRNYLYSRLEVVHAKEAV
jgi:predicted DNA-binding transcriptional regulator AlpA